MQSLELVGRGGRQFENSKCPQGTTRQLKRLATTAGEIGTPQTSNAELEHRRPGRTEWGNRKGLRVGEIDQLDPMGDQKSGR